MLERLHRSWDLAKASLEVVKADKELLWFPIMSALAGLLVAASFIAPVLYDGWLPGAVDRQDPLLFAWGAAFYIASFFVMFYFNTALVGAAMIRLEGGDPTVSDGFRIANERFWHILGYAIIAATVGLILRAIEERVGLIGKIVVGLIGAAWTVATFLVVPVLVVRKVGPLDAVKESVSLLRQTWGENLIGAAGLGLAFFIAWIVLAAVMIPLMILGAKALGGVAFGVLLVAFIVAGIALAVLHATLQGIYSAALYRYATGGQPGFGFDAAQVKQAFVPRGGPTVQ
jgi:hypothetical protein